MVSSIGLNMMNNGAFGNMMNNSTRLGMIGQGGDPAMLQQKEKGLMADNLNNQLLYSAGDLMQQSADKVKEDNIKRSFNMFA